jgi:hypothetical protein
MEVVAPAKLGSQTGVTNWGQALHYCLFIKKVKNTRPDHSFTKRSKTQGLTLTLAKGQKHKA